MKTKNTNKRLSKNKKIKIILNINFQYNIYLNIIYLYKTSKYLLPM